MTIPRIMIAAPNSGSGKTTITCGLLQALKNAGKNPCSFKCGPDYIDPMYHRQVLGISAGNLDTFFTDNHKTVSIFAEEAEGDIAVIEGVMGLFDGVGGIQEMGSSYDVANALECPIVLVVDARGAGRSVLAQIKGFLDYDKYNLIKAVILNKTSPGFGNILKPLIEEELGITCLGVMPNDSQILVSSRHLGLVLPEEIPGLIEQQKKVAELLAENISMDELLKIAGDANELVEKDSHGEIEYNVNTNPIRLAVARDEAFCFYYRENLRMLQKNGVELVEFSPLKDKSLPENISGLLLGGGYPENYLEQLSANTQMKASIKEALESGIPTLAECGGFMYLLDEIQDKEGASFQMVGALKGKAYWTGKLVRFGYVTIDDNSGMEIKGHEFHYYDTDNNGEDCVATKPTGSRSWACIHHKNGSYMGFAHLYYPSNPKFVSNFVEAMKNYGRN